MDDSVEGEAGTAPPYGLMKLCDVTYDVLSDTAPCWAVKKSCAWILGPGLLAPRLFHEMQ